MDLIKHGSTRRRCLLLFGMLAGLFAPAAGVWLLWPRTAITRENAANIRIGMALADVENLFGGSDRDESTGPLTGEVGYDGAAPNGGGVEVWAFQNLRRAGSVPPRIWTSNNVVIRVYLDANDRVARCDLLAVRRIDESAVEMIRRLLRL